MVHNFNNLVPKCQCLAQVIFKILMDILHLIKVCKVTKIKWVLVLDLKCPNIQVVVLTHLMVVVLINHLAEISILCLNMAVVVHQLLVVTVQRHNLITLLIVKLLLLEVDLAIAHNLLVHVRHPSVHHHLMDHNLDRHTEVMAHSVMHQEQHHSVIHMADIIEERTQVSYFLYKFKKLFN